MQLNDPSVAVIACICDVLDMICDNLNYGYIAPFLPTIVPKLISLAQQSHSSTIQATAVAALSSLIVTSEAHYQPYTYTTFPLLIQLFEQQDIVIKSTAINALGRLAIAISKTQDTASLTHFVNLLHPILLGAKQGDLTLVQAAVEYIGDLSVSTDCSSSDES